MTCPSSRSRAGFTLVELLIVMFLLAVVGSIVAVGVSAGARADREAQSRIEAFEDMQIGLERMSREIRGAVTPLPAAVLDENGEWIQVQVLRDGEGACVQYTYWVDVDNDLRARQESSTDGCTTFGADGESILVPDLADRTIFTFETDAYVKDSDGNYKFDTDGNKMRHAATEVEDISFVSISLTRALLEGQEATVSTVVGLRNDTQGTR